MSHDQVIEWLLEPDNPPVRYLTLTNLLAKPATDPEVRRARARLMDYQVTQAILRRFSEFCDDDARAYWKYKGKHWQLIFLGQFLADGQDPRIARLAESILAERQWVTKAGGQCLTANILAALTRLGYGEHPRVVEEREALARRVNAEGGLKCAVMDYSLLSRCYMAQPKLLLCFAQVPPKKRSTAIRAAIKLLASNLVEHQVFLYVPANRKAWQAVIARQPKAADLPPGQTVKQWIARQRERFVAERGLGPGEPKAGWLKFGFPLHYNSDVLEAMYALALAGTPYTPQLARPLQAVRDKQTAQGRWILENSMNGKMLADVESKGKPSKWLTYFARYVLKHFSR
jgi:hypothetical protein